MHPSPTRVKLYMMVVINTIHDDHHDNGTGRSLSLPAARAAIGLEGAKQFVRETRMYSTGGDALGLHDPTVLGSAVRSQGRRPRSAPRRQDAPTTRSGRCLAGRSSERPLTSARPDLARRTETKHGRRRPG